METKCLHLLSIFCSLSAMLCTHRNNIYGIHFLLAQGDPFLQVGEELRLSHED